MKYFTYWENPKGVDSIPPYILLGIASMRRFLGDDFELLTPKNLNRYVPYSLISEKDWGFTNKPAHLCADVLRIVATSDFLRMYVIAEHGGIWLDADTIVLRDFRADISRMMTEKFLWHCEAFFGAQRGNAILNKVYKGMLVQEKLNWGNTGGIKDIVRENRPQIDSIPMYLHDSGYLPLYCAKDFMIMFDRVIPIEDFLLNPRQGILKLYNSQFVRHIDREITVSDFINSDMLLARVFKSLESDKRYWIDSCDEIFHSLRHRKSEG